MRKSFSILSKKFIFLTLFAVGVAYAGKSLIQSGRIQSLSLPVKSVGVTLPATLAPTQSKTSASLNETLNVWAGFNPFGSGVNLDPTLAGGTEMPSIDSIVRLDLNDLFGDGEGYCTGSVIAPNIILTAAHCFPGTSKNRRLSIRGYKSGTRIRHTDSMVTIEKNDNFKATPETNRYDIALIRVGFDLINNDTLIMELDSTKENNKSYKSIIGGYGNTGSSLVDDFNPTYKEANTETKVTLGLIRPDGTPVIPIKCRDENILISHPSMHCVHARWTNPIGGNIYSRIDPIVCKGDSGGPLRTANRQFAVSQSVTILGLSAGEKYHINDALCPAVYAWFAPLDSENRDWIKSKMKALKSINREISADQKGCYPRWQDTPAKNPKTGACDGASFDKQPLDKNNLNLDAEIRPISYPQCTVADLRTLALYNRTNNTDALIATARTTWNSVIYDPWSRVYNTELARLNRLSRLDRESGYESKNEYLARQKAGAEPVFNYTGPQGTVIDLSKCIEDVYSTLPAGNDTCIKAYRQWFMHVTLQGLPATGFNAGCTGALFSGRTPIGGYAQWDQVTLNEFDALRKFFDSIHLSSGTSTNATGSRVPTIGVGSSFTSFVRFTVDWGGGLLRQCDIPATTMININNLPFDFRITAITSYVSQNCPL